MGKIKIKTIGVILSVMLLLNLTQAELNSIGGFLCKGKCVIKCSNELFSQHCIKDCESHCSDEVSSNPAYNCINNCRLIKYIATDIGMYPLKIFIYFHYFIILILYLISLFYLFDN